MYAVSSPSHSIFENVTHPFITLSLYLVNPRSLPTFPSPNPSAYTLKPVMPNKPPLTHHYHPNFQISPLLLPTLRPQPHSSHDTKKPKESNQQLHRPDNLPHNPPFKPLPNTQHFNTTSKTHARLKTCIKKRNRSCIELL